MYSTATAEKSIVFSVSGRPTRNAPRGQLIEAAMATIASSQIVENSLQADGRRAIRERHIDNGGVPHFYPYFAEILHDINAIMAARIATVIRDIENEEMERNIVVILRLGRLAILNVDVTTIYTTAQQNADVMRAVYRGATQVTAIMLADWLSDRTDAQLQNAFGMTSAQVTSLRTSKLTPARSLADSIRAAVGQ